MRHYYLSLLALLIIIPTSGIFAQDAGKSLAVLPLCSTGIDSNYARTAESILRVEVSKRAKAVVIPERITKSIAGKNCCMDVDCIVRIGKELNAEQVLSCNLSALGEKIIVQYYVTDVANAKQIIIDQVTAKTIEDLELVMKRIAKSAVNNEAINDRVEVGTITAVETDKPLRRSTFKNWGISFGYLYPTSGYDSTKSKIFVLDVRWGYEIEENYSAGLLAGIRNGFALNLFGDYLLTKTDVCPQIGGSLGFHWVEHNEGITYPPSTKRSDGIELGAHAGLRLLRTYSFQILLQVDYIHTFNDYNDNAVVFTIGLL